MPIPKKRSNPKVGSEFVKNYKGKAFKLKVVKTESGIGFEVAGTVYSSPSTAAKSFTRSEVNGWKFWKID